MSGTQAGRLFFSGTINSGTALTEIIPSWNSGNEEVLIDYLMTDLDIFIGIGGTLPTSNGIVTVYYRKDAADSNWKMYKSFQTPSVINRTDPYHISIKPSYYQYKVAYVGADTQNFTLEIWEGRWKP